MHPEWFIKIICKDRILAQSQGGALRFHERAADVERDDSLVRFKVKTDIIVIFSNCIRCYTNSFLAARRAFCLIFHLSYSALE